MPNIDYTAAFKSFSTDSPGMQEFRRLRSVLLPRASGVVFRMGYKGKAVPKYDAVQERLSAMFVSVLHENGASIPPVPTIFVLSMRYDIWAIGVIVAYLELYDKVLLARRWGAHVNDVFSAWNGGNPVHPADNTLLYEDQETTEMRAADLIAVKGSTSPARWMFFQTPPRDWSLVKTRKEEDGLDCYEQVVELTDIIRKGAWSK
jgi:hypothetical protein